MKIRMTALVLVLVLALSTVPVLAQEPADQVAASAQDQTDTAEGEAAQEPSPAGPDQDGAETEPDPEGTVRFASLERRIRASNLQIRALDENIAALEELDYEEIQEDLRQLLNQLSAMQWGMGAMGDSYTQNTLKQTYDATREQFEAISSRYEIICCDSLASSADARRAYLVSMANWRAARRIYPRTAVLRTADVMFAQLCQEIMCKRETLEQYEQSLSGLRSSNSELIPTLTVYLLDAGSSMAETAKLLYVHLNTVKYRLRQIQELTGLSPTQMPDSYSLYIAAAIDRISGE